MAVSKLGVYVEDLFGAQHCYVRGDAYDHYYPEMAFIPVALCNFRDVFGCDVLVFLRAEKEEETTTARWRDRNFILAVLMLLTCMIEVIFVLIRYLSGSL